MITHLRREAAVNIAQRAKAVIDVHSDYLVGDKFSGNDVELMIHSIDRVSPVKSLVILSDKDGFEWEGFFHTSGSLRTRRTSHVIRPKK